MRTFGAYLAIGVIGGFLSGLFGVGGGFVIVPLLMMLLHFSLKQAAATSLTAIAVTALAGTVSFAFSDGVIWLAALLLSVGSMVGSFVGARLLKVVPSVVIMWIFVALVTALAVRMLFTWSAPDGVSTFSFGVWQDFGLFLLGFAAGMLAGLLGVGGGIIVVPVLIFLFSMPSFQAKGTSLVMLIPASIVGTWVNFRNKLVDVRAGLTIGAIAGLVSYFGVLTAKHMPEALNNLLFAILMFAIAAQFAVRAIRAKRSATGQ